jgi:hypothetical protein
MTEDLSIYGKLLNTLIVHDRAGWSEIGSGRAHDDHIRSSFHRGVLLPRLTACSNIGVARAFKKKSHAATSSSH